MCGLWRIWFAAMATAAWALATVAGAQTLSDERWREGGYGVSLLPPQRAQIIEHTSDGALAKFIVGDDYYISVAIRQHFEALDMADVSKKAVEQFGFAYPDAGIVASQEVRIAGRPGARLDMQVNDEEDGPWVYGQAFMKLDPRTVAVFSFECDSSAYDRVARIFEAMLDSVEVADAEELDKARMRLIEAGQLWRSSLTPQVMHAALVEEQLYRVLLADRDVGYVRVRQWESEELDAPGIRIEITSRIEAGQDLVDSKRDYFASDDHETEYWSIRTTRRPKQDAPVLQMDGEPVGPALHSWAETGVRSGPDLTVTKEGPDGIDELHWRIPPEGYLSQMEAELLEPLLPRDRVTTLGFYCYHSLSGKLTFRSLEVTPLDNGAFQLRTQPGPDQPAHVTIYNREGKLLRRQMHDGRVWMPTTRQQLEQIWRTR